MTLISELEDKRLRTFKSEVQELESRMELVAAPLDPTDALRQYAVSGERADALRALMSQPYLGRSHEEAVSLMAEDLLGLDEDSGKRMMKQLPLNRAKRRALLSSENWAVHLCSGKPQEDNPFRRWAEERQIQLLEVDLLAKGGKGWDLTCQHGVWRVLLWAAATGRIVSVFSSPHTKVAATKPTLGLQPMFLWSLASVARGKGIPFVFEAPRDLECEYRKFLAWSGGTELQLNQPAPGCENPRIMRVCTNVDLGHFSALQIGKPASAIVCNRQCWNLDFRQAVVSALQGEYHGPSTEELDKMITKAISSNPEAIREEDEVHPPHDIDQKTGADLVDEPVRPVPEAKPADSPKCPFSKKEIDSWKQHLLDGHIPYRRDCRLCVEGTGIGIQHRRVAYPQAFALSIDLFGPVPKHEHGRDETCISGKK